MTTDAYSPEQVATKTSLSIDEIKRALRAGELRAKRRGRRVLIPADALAKWLDSLEDY